MDANRTKVSLAKETAFDTVPTNPIFRELRIKSSNLRFNPETKVSEELRADRQIADLIRVGYEAGGDVPLEMSYGNIDYGMEGIMQSTWVQAPVRYNNGTADGVISDVTATDVTVTANASTEYNYGVFKEGHLVRTTGFTNAGNNGLRRAGAGTTATIIKLAGGTIEAAPPGTARAKVVGFEGASGDITASATGLASTALDFTTLGLAVGMWIKIGGTAAGTKFSGVAANNDFARISAIAATALTLDNRPSGWNTDAGAGKTIQVWFGDYIRNGTTFASYSVEQQFQDLTAPEYDVYSGMAPSELELALQAQDIVQAKLGFMGATVANSTSRTAGATDIAALTHEIMNTSSNVGRIAENGSPISSPVFVTAATINVNNNLRRRKAIGSQGTVSMGSGQFSVTGQLSMYYANNTIRAKLLAGTATSINFRFTDPDATRCVILDLPRIKLTSGDPTVPGINQDRMFDPNFQALRDATLGYTMHYQRMEEYVA